MQLTRLTALVLLSVPAALASGQDGPAAPIQVRHVGGATNLASLAARSDGDLVERSPRSRFGAPRVSGPRTSAPSGATRGDVAKAALQPPKPCNLFCRLFGGSEEENSS
ncbi:hypothetical protein PpBr36_06856 [Pyricularia pennisetigena]|uniref:hypothetical protein n=1 Tax=Pyricularia pennisetigena TaxID=1578925 RepID=UPI001150E20E|nr:hypothetical protein PpBr36_06856 [Pyricularia pennisetigena]TLS25458.1 hypothetical protein PpBr36_06856 [Pyricularia pennisetigena]